MPSLVESYIEHICLAIRVDDRQAPFAAFFAAWWNARHRQDAVAHPVWTLPGCPVPGVPDLTHFAFALLAAARTLGGFGSEYLVTEPAVPAAALRDVLFALPPDRDQVRATLCELHLPGLITRAEQDDLIATRLRTTMPDGWRPSDGPYARLASIGITFQELATAQPRRLGRLPGQRVLVKPRLSKATLLGSGANRLRQNTR